MDLVAVGEEPQPVPPDSLFEIDTDVPLADSPDADVPDYDPALGFTSRGFGMAIGEGDEGWEATATVRWGPRDRADMNAAIPLA